MKRLKAATVTVVLILLVGCLVGGVLSTQFSVLGVKGHSMEPGIKSGALVIIKKSMKCKRGNIVVFKKKKQKFLKRVVAVEGDEIEARHGYLEVNGKRVKEDYVTGITEDVYCTVPRGKVFVLGDNREHSIDSRHFGCVKTNSLMGRVVFVRDN